MFKKSILTLSYALLAFIVYGQKSDLNLKDGFIAEGYDVVSYFLGNPVKGSKELVYQYEEAKLKFSSKENLQIFKSNPEKYLPQYGGWCAYAIGAKAEKVKIDPKTYEIREGRLYLFYNAWGTNTLEMWIEEGANSLREKADKNWMKMVE